MMVSDVLWEVPGEQFARLLHRRDQTVARPPVLQRIDQASGDPSPLLRLHPGMNRAVGDDFHLMLGQRNVDQHGGSPHGSPFRADAETVDRPRTEEHTSGTQYIKRHSYAV